MSTFGQRLKKTRNELRLSQAEFGEKVGLTRAAIAAVEANNNKFSQEVLCKLILTFRININYLLVGTGAMFNPPQYEDVKDEILKEVDEILKKYGVKNI